MEELTFFMEQSKMPGINVIKLQLKKFEAKGNFS